MKNVLLIFVQAVQAVLWNEEKGAWFDYDLMNRKQRLYFAPTNLSPLYFGCYDKANKDAIARKVLDYIDASGIDAFPGGLPSTIVCYSILYFNFIAFSLLFSIKINFEIFRCRPVNNGKTILTQIFEIKLYFKFTKN